MQGNLDHRIARTTIANTLKAHGLQPSPKRPTQWRDFLLAHKDSIAACDFLTPEVCERYIVVRIGGWFILGFSWYFLGGGWGWLDLGRWRGSGIGLG